MSLVPSITEWLFDVGLGDRVVGITKFCVRPDAWFRSKTRVGGTKNPSIDRVLALNPDLVLANKEENDQPSIDILKAQVPVWVSDIKNTSDAVEMMSNLGKLLECGPMAERINKGILSANSTLKLEVKTAVYAVWNEPFMLAGNDTFIHHMMELGGFKNLVDQARYPMLDPEQLASLKPDVILLPCEPFPFSEKHLPTVQTTFPDAKLMLVDGEIFSWYGSRMLHAARYFEAMREGL